MDQTVLLTGATGALGPILAAELLRSGAARQLNVLIRANEDSAAERFERWTQTVEAVLESVGAPFANVRGRLRLLAGDLCAEGLGLDQHSAALAAESDVIIHGAAETNFRGSGEAHFETNVQGTRRVLELASRCRRLTKFIHVSTICASGIQSGLIHERFISDEPSFANPYEKTKWEAERMVLGWDLPIEIVRVGIVMGSSVTGAVYRLGAFHHVLRWFGSGMMPEVPGTPHMPVDLIDSELAAKFIRKVAGSPLAQNAIYHAAAGRRAVLLSDLFDFSTEHLLHEDYDATLIQHHAKRSPRATRLAKAWLPVLLAGRTYDTSNAEALWGGPLPLADWRGTLEKVIHFCGFVRPKAVSLAT